jgi:hypothetical protein
MPSKTTMTWEPSTKAMEEDSSWQSPSGLMSATHETRVLAYRFTGDQGTHP